MKQAIFLIKLGVIVIVVAIVLRLAGYDNLHTVPPIGFTPGALHRLTDTIFLCAIALGLVEIHRVLQGRSPERLPEATPDESKEKDKTE